MAQVAQDTFVAQLADGSSLRVTRGSTWADRHEVVKMDGGRGHLFKPLDLDEADAPKSEAEAGPDPGPDPGAGPEVTPEPEPGAPPAEPAAAPVSAGRPRRGAKASS